MHPREAELGVKSSNKKLQTSTARGFIGGVMAHVTAIDANPRKNNNIHS